MGVSLSGAAGGCLCPPAGAPAPGSDGRDRAGRARLAHPPPDTRGQAAPRQLPRLPRHPGPPPHRISDCRCIPSGRWCHGVRAATTNPHRLTAWWHAEPAAVPGIAAGPSGLVLIDIDAHHDQLPPELATGLLPGINLALEPIARELWDNRGRFRDGRDSLRLFAAIRGGPTPWPADPACRPVTVATPSGGRHLWYRAPAPGLRQALSDPGGQHGLAWQVDVKAGWSYGLAPGAVTTAGTYEICTGDPAKPGNMPGWLSREVIRVSASKPAAPPLGPALPPAPGPRGAAYLTTVINRGADQLAVMNDGRKRELAKLAYHVGGLLGWSGLPADYVTDQLADAGIASGLSPRDARRIVRRGLANGIAQPIAPNE